EDKMKKIFTFLLIIGVVLMIMGCDGGGDEPTVRTPYQGGSEGLEVDFEYISSLSNGMPTVYEDQGFPIELKIQNKGEFEIPSNDIKFQVIGIANNLFSGLDTGEVSYGNDLNEKTRDYDGGEAIISFGGNVEYIPELTKEFYVQTFTIEYEYPYETYATIPRVCYKYDVRDERICDMGGSQSLFVSGAPIQISSAVQERVGQGIFALSFDIVNAGGGQVTSDDYIATLNAADRDTKDYHSVFGYVDYEITPADDFVCRSIGPGEGIARLENNRATVRCTLKNDVIADGATPFTKPIDIKLNYKYRDYVDQSVMVEKQI
ncbi:hypothetical protein ACFL1H_08350, partial [Nanoarchaeota archaeon]